MLLERDRGDKRAVRNNTSEWWTKIFPALKVHTQTLLILLIKIDWTEGKALGSEEVGTLRQSEFLCFRGYLPMYSANSDLCCLKSHFLKTT
jgi:hypothetical protein